MFNVMDLLLRYSIPITKFVSTIHSPFSRKEMHAKDYYDLKAKLVPGCVLLSRVRGEFSNAFVPGFWTHAGIVDKDLNVIEAITKGVSRTDLIDFVLRKDFVCAMLPKFLNQEQLLAAVERAEQHIGKTYDFSFQYTVSDNKAFYCSELVWDAYANNEIAGHIPFSPRLRFGQMTVVPEDFAQACSKFAPLFVSENAPKEAHPCS